MKETLADIGEREIINRLKGFMPSGQTDDDVAEINSPDKKLIIALVVMKILVVICKMMFNKYHFNSLRCFSGILI